MSYSGTATARKHPNGPSTTQWINPGETTAIFLCVYVPYIIETVTSVSGSITTSGPAMSDSPRWFWDSSPTNYSYSATVSVTSLSQLPAKFSTSKQLLFVRKPFKNTGTSGENGSISSFSISITGTFRSLDKKSVGDTITVADMTTLKSYIDTLASGIKISNGNSITLPTAGNKIFPSDWSTFITKANGFQHVSGLTVPSQNDAATAAYYNTIVDAVK